MIPDLVQNYWKLIWNHCSIRKSIFWQFFLIKKSKNNTSRNLICESHHLVMNPGQGPILKCAPGHKSVEDWNIIKSYWPKSGVVQIQNRRVSFLYFFCSRSTALNAITAFPGNSFVAFNQSPILQVSRIGGMPEMGFSSYPVNELLGNSVVPFMAVDVERHKWIPREYVCDHSNKKICFCCWD